MSRRAHIKRAKVLRDRWYFDGITGGSRAWDPGYRWPINARRANAIRSAYPRKKK